MTLVYCDVLVARYVGVDRLVDDASRTIVATEGLVFFDQPSAVAVTPDVMAEVREIVGKVFRDYLSCGERRFATRRSEALALVPALRLHSSAPYVGKVASRSGAPRPPSRAKFLLYGFRAVVSSGSGRVARARALLPPLLAHPDPAQQADFLILDLPAPEPRVTGKSDG